MPVHSFPTRRSSDLYSLLTKPKFQLKAGEKSEKKVKVISKLAETSISACPSLCARKRKGTCKTRRYHAYKSQRNRAY
jgi:hypothetical protein